MGVADRDLTWPDVEEVVVNKGIVLREDSRVSTAPGSLSTTVQDEVVILDPASGRYFGLDRVGARVWELMTASTSWSELLSTITTEFDVDHARAEQDLRVLLEDLATKELIVVE